MSQVKNFQFKVRPELSGKSLKDCVYLFLTEIRKIKISKREVKALIDSGKVHFRGKKAFKSNLSVDQGEGILISLPIEFVSSQDQDIKIDFELSNETIVYEDDAIIAVNKPSGLSTSASLDPNRDHLYAAVKRYLNANMRASTAYAGLHHRLDVDTSGLVVFTKKKSANKSLGNQFEFRKIKKQYLAICFSVDGNKPKSNFWVRNHLGRQKADQDKKLLRMESVSSGGDRAETRFELISENFSEHCSGLSKSLIDCLQSQDSALYLFRAFPKTGRTHQIRVHLFEEGLPILGDRFYGQELATRPESERLLLHAEAMSFEHPITGEKLELSAPFDVRHRLNLKV